MSRFFWFVGLWLSVIPLVSAGTLNVTFNSIPAGSVINLTTNGVLDWVHWGLFTETSIDRKGGVTPLISDFTPVDASNGFVYVYQFGDNANGYSWSDGTPHMSVTNTTTGVWAYGTPAAGSGFRISVPASTNLQTLKVYVGAFAAKGRFVAGLSDQSAPNYTNPANATVNNFANGPSAVYSINFAANSPGETLTVVYTLEQVQGPNASSANVTLQAAALTSPGANNVPFVTLTSPAEGTSVVTPTNIFLSAIASDVDGAISSVEFFDGTNSIGTVSNAPYEFTWTDPPVGQHVITARAADDVGAIGTSTPATVFVASGGGSISGARGTSPTALDLTVEGTSDWAHWGLRSAADFNHKSTGASQISNFTRIGTNTVQRYTDNRTAFSWSDGTPVAAVANTNTGVFINGLTNGFEFTVPADTNMRTLRVYAGLYGAQGNFQAWLTDFSGQAYTDTSLSNVFGNSYVFYTLNYAAASPNQSLVVRYTSQNVFDFDFGNITLQAATLEGLSAPHTNLPPVVSITNPTNGSAFVAPASFVIEASASDSDGTITQVEFFNGDASIGVDASSPYTADISGLAVGTYTLSAVATDNESAKATNSVTVTVISAPTNMPPMVQITSPTNGAAFVAPASFTIEASASDSDGSVTQVEFFNGGISIGLDSTAPYAMDVSGLASGIYSFSAVATDNGGATATNTISVAVTNAPGNNPPFVQITTPTNGAAFMALSAITIEANANDSDGSVTNVEFYAGATFLGADNVAPFSITVSNLVSGSYVLTARAFDNLGASTNSAPVSITVSSNTPVATRIVNPRLLDGAFLFSFETQSGAPYTVEFTSSLAPIEWHTLTNFVAPGSSVTVTNAVSGAQQFYRVRSD